MTIWQRPGISDLFFTGGSKLSRVVKIITQNNRNIRISEVFVENLKNDTAIEGAKCVSIVKRNKPCHMGSTIKAQRAVLNFLMKFGKPNLSTQHCGIYGTHHEDWEGAYESCKLEESAHNNFVPGQLKVALGDNKR